jgi:hypothetical protein
MKASYWLILSNCEGTDEASKTLEIVFDNQSSTLRHIRHLQELLFVHNHTFFEN